ncbi:hypothetical protein GCM10010401_13120 [Rarobacter faecitabidus]|uniref:Uncharacterized protein n=1 Tax=Rarobacter faecitabidus TaxID=13243 RepID=A0A542ZEC7_RARFA|nr:hypothetical protein [Rarobacter faecitabidus]TQL58639.1 hypothetical protein FB461_2057 [Rarobacter faecitabidus]
MTFRLILAATGLRRTLPLFIAAAAVGIAVPDGMIDRLGPIMLQPVVPVVTFVPVLVGFAFGILNDAWPVAVIARNRRLIASRAVSLATATLLAILVVVVIASLSDVATAATLTRNVLWIAGLALAVGSLYGATYAWLPGAVLYLAAIVWGPSDSAFSPYMLLLVPVDQALDIVVPACVAAAALVIGVANPRNLGWLPRVQ